MKNKCSQCDLVNFPSAEVCSRCTAVLERAGRASRPKTPWPGWLLIRAGAVLMTCVFIIAGFYISLVASAERLSIQQKETVRRAIKLLQEKHFDTESMMLSNLTAFRKTDNWLNASVAKENAYASTNFPFEIITLYDDFFTYPADDVEKAAILLHEARHLLGDGEKEAYEYVWKNRTQLGWTQKAYRQSPVWLNVRDQTRENVPDLFNCPQNPASDCTETQSTALNAAAGH